MRLKCIMEFQQHVGGAEKDILSVAPVIVWPRAVFVTVTRTVQTDQMRWSVKLVSRDRSFMIVEEQGPIVQN